MGFHLQRSPDHLVGFKRGYFYRGEGAEGRGKKGRERGWKGREGKKIGIPSKIVVSSKPMHACYHTVK